MTRFLPILILALAATGCATPQKDARVLSLKDANTDVIVYPTELRGAYVVRSESGLRYCAEPAPDVALDALQKISANAKSATGVGGGLDSEFSSKAAQLAGRTQLLLLAREMLYRACELTLNHPGPGSEKEALEMYRIVAGLVQDLGKADRAQAEADLLKASYAEGKDAQCIESWRKVSAENNNVLKEWLANDPDHLSIPVFLYGKGYSDRRSSFIKQKNISCK